MLLVFSFMVRSPQSHQSLQDIWYFEIDYLVGGFNPSQKKNIRQNGSSPHKKIRGHFFHIFSKPLSYVNVEKPFAGYYSVIFPLVVEFSRSHLWKLSCHTGSWDISSWHKHCKNYFRWGSQETVRQIFSQQTLFWICTLIEYTLKTSLLLLPTSEISMHTIQRYIRKKMSKLKSRMCQGLWRLGGVFTETPTAPPNPNPSPILSGVFSMLRKPSWALHLKSWWNTVLHEICRNSYVPGSINFHHFHIGHKLINPIVGVKKTHYKDFIGFLLKVGWPSPKIATFDHGSYYLIWSSTQGELLVTEWYGPSKTKPLSPSSTNLTLKLDPWTDPQANKSSLHWSDGGWKPCCSDQIIFKLILPKMLCWNQPPGEPGRKKAPHAQPSSILEDCNYSHCSQNWDIDKKNPF